MIKGEPLEAGVIRFIPVGETEGPAAVATIREGAYAFSKADGPVAGTHRVEIEAIDHLGFAPDDEAAYVEQIEKRGRRLPPNPVPEIYNRQSRLEAHVTGNGERRFDFHLETNTAAAAGR